jgi:hypothetical protein
MLNRLISYIALLFGVLLLFLGYWKNDAYQQYVKSWPIIEAKVLSAQVVWSGHLDRKYGYRSMIGEGYVPELTVRYTVNGADFSKKIIPPGPTYYESFEKANLAIKDYLSNEGNPRENLSVRVIRLNYDPKLPELAIPIGGEVFTGGILFWIGISLILLGGFSFFSFRPSCSA